MKADINNFLEELEYEVNKKKKKLALTVAQKLTNRSPVLTGMYVKNHKVGINKINTNVTGEYFIDFLGLDRFAGPASFAKVRTKRKKAFRKMIPKIQNTKLNDDIFISNSVYYSDLVEYIGWKKTPAYHVYGLTVAELMI